MFARSEAVEEGNKKVEYRMMEGQRGVLAKKRKRVVCYMASSGGTGSRIRMNDSHSYLVLSRTA